MAEDGAAGQGDSKKITPRPQRKKSQKRRRSAQFKTPMTPQEYAEASALAAAAGMTRAAWSRSKLLGTPGPRSQRRMPTDAKAMREIIGHLGRVGNNLNQIAYHLNTGDAPDIPELRQALADYAPIRNAIYKIIGLDPAPPTPPDKPGGARTT